MSYFSPLMSNPFSSPGGGGAMTPLMMEAMRRSQSMPGSMSGGAAPQVPTLPGAPRAQGGGTSVGPMTGPQPQQSSMASLMGPLAGMNGLKSMISPAASGPPPVDLQSIVSPSRGAFLPGAQPQNISAMGPSAGGFDFGGGLTAGSSPIGGFMPGGPMGGYELGGGLSGASGGGMFGGGMGGFELGGGLGAMDFGALGGLGGLDLLGAGGAGIGAGEVGGGLAATIASNPELLMLLA